MYVTVIKLGAVYQVLIVTEGMLAIDGIKASETLIAIKQYLPPG